jgi:cytosine deaminase
MHELLRAAVDVGADVVGGRPHGDPVGALDYDRHIADVLEIADGRPVDMSVDALFPADRDELPEPTGLGVYRLAKAVIERGYGPGGVTAHHVLALSAVETGEARAVIEQVRAAGMSILTQPTSNLFTEGRTDANLPRRGLTRVKDFLQAGVNMGMGTDNLDDTYLPFANMDLLLEAHVCAVAAHLGNQDERRALLGMVTHGGARALGLEGYGAKVGDRADLVVLDAFTYDDITTTQPAKAFVIKAGRVVAEGGASPAQPYGEAIQ